MSSAFQSRLQSTLVLALLMFGAGCAAGGAAAAGAHRSSETRLPIAGESDLQVSAFAGIPILQKSFFWDGNGEDDTAGAKLRYLWHATDDLAIGAGLTGVGFFRGGRDGLAGEIEAVGRYFFYRGDSLGVYWDLTGGWLQANDQVPVGGTEWNMTFSFGPGLQVPIEDRLDLITGVTYHHVSNALGRQNDRNPSQNEAQLWLGLSFRL
ncbi:MAG: hypothetical protein KDE27_19965 [Planctomycetes bacterium]|nr:hypothetical protein [Planctomycetota bacterium]